MKTRIKKVFLLGTMIILQVFFLNTELFAGDTGKISGTLTDIATGEPMPGANIVLRGTYIGAATDLDGYYYIINVPPGTYSVEASIIGYVTQIKTNVRVNADRTIKLDFNLETSVIEGEEVYVVADREIVRQDVSSTQINLSLVDIESQPVANVEEILMLQPGITLSQSGLKGSGLSIRGGGIEETDFQINGVSLKDDLSDVSFMKLPKSSIEEVQILSGGFSAEYGGVRSGLINVITKEGSLDKYDGAIDIRYSAPARKHFGPDAFDQNGRIWQVIDGPKAFVGTTSEDVELYKQTNGKEGYPFEFRGWNTISREYLNDDDPNNDITPQHALELWKIRHRPVDYTSLSDYDIDASFGGPIPFSILGKQITFNGAYRHETIQFPYPLSRKEENNNTYHLKLTTWLTPKLKLSLGNLYGEKFGVSVGYAEDIGAISGSYWGPMAATASGSRSGVEYAAGNFGFRSMYAQGYHSLRDDFLYRLNFRLSYLHSTSTVSEFSYQFGKNWVDARHMRQRSDEKIFQIGDKSYDETPLGWNGSLSGSDQTKLFYLGGGGERLNESSNLYHNLNYSLLSQLNKHNQVKVGLGVKFMQIKSRSAIFWLPVTQTYEEAPWTWQRWDENPVNGYFYIQDKLEFEGMIANIGLRTEYLDPKTNAYEYLTPYDGYYTPQRFSVGAVQDIFFDSKRTENVKPKIKIQPRIGISHPVSDKGKIYFNYGHFYQPPDDYRLYSFAVTGGGAPGFLAPSPNLDWPRTIQYEVGYEHQIFNLFLVRAAGYYKNITGQFKFIQGINWAETVNNHIWTNDEYADIRGIELGFNKPYGDFLTFWSNFDYSVSTRGVTSLDVIYENPFKAEEEKSFIQKTKPIPYIGINAGLGLHIKSDWGPELLGGRIFSNINLNLLYNWNDGGEFIFNPEAPTENQHYIDVVNFSNLDLKLEKSFSLGSSRATLYMDVRNLLNLKYLFTGGFTFVESQEYRNSLHLPWEKGDQKGDDKWGDFPDDGNNQHIEIGWRNWIQFLNPRDIHFGVRFAF